MFKETVNFCKFYPKKVHSFRCKEDGPEPQKACSFYEQASSGLAGLGPRWCRHCYTEFGALTDNCFSASAREAAKSLFLDIRK